MSEYSVNIPKGSVQRAGRIEYALYFALIFAVALPIAALVWVLRTVTGHPDRRGPWARAQAEARAITPMIFRA
jgi:hypothetical protein